MLTQEVIDMMNQSEKETRANYHVTLGQLIDHLKANSNLIVGLEHPHSFRGYYTDLALESSRKGMWAGDLAKQLEEEVLDKILQGYKGGYYLMDKDTPIWISDYGTSCDARALVDLGVNGGFISLTSKIVD